MSLASPAGRRCGITTGSCDAFAGTVGPVRPEVRESERPELNFLSPTSSQSEAG